MPFIQCDAALLTGPVYEISERKGAASPLNQRTERRHFATQSANKKGALCNSICERKGSLRQSIAMIISETT